MLPAAAAGPAGSPLMALPAVPGGGPGPTNFLAKIHVHREKCYIVFRSETCFFSEEDFHAAPTIQKESSFPQLEDTQ